MRNENKKQKADLIIANGTLLTLASGSVPIQNGAVAISGGRIAALGTTPEIRKSFVASKSINALGGLIMPGLVNAHTHAAMTCYRGLADDLPLMEWLNQFVFPAEAKSDGDQVYWSTLLACAEMIRSGTTTFCDMYLFEDRVAQAAKEARIRAVVGEVLYDFPSPHYGPIEKGLEFTESLIKHWQKDPLVTIAIEPHALYTCSPDLLKKCRSLADRYGASLITHLSENQGEVEEVMKKYGRRPVDHLENLGLLSSPLIACHCVWLTEEEMDLLARRKVRVVHNPESNMKLASGVAPVPDLLARGVTVGLGTDGCASNNNLDLFQEMDSAAKLHKVHRLDPTVMPSQTVLEMATLGGARVLGMEKEIGSLEAGKKADVIVLDLNRPHLQPVYNLTSHLVYSATGADVRDVIIDGKVVMENRKILTLDEEEVLDKAREWGKRIFPKLPGSPGEGLEFAKRFCPGP
jgi:5-methylthioadenosine/S-adenosylhomocysteine deaminase